MTQLSSNYMSGLAIISTTTTAYCIVFALFSVGGKKFKGPPNIILTVFKSSMFLWLLVWFAILSLKTFLFDTNIDLSLSNLEQNSNEGNNATLFFSSLQRRLVRATDESLNTEHGTYEPSSSL